MSNKVLKRLGRAMARNALGKGLRRVKMTRTYGYNRVLGPGFSGDVVREFRRPAPRNFNPKRKPWTYGLTYEDTDVDRARRAELKRLRKRAPNGRMFGKRNYP